MTKQTLVLDTECYEDYWLLALKHVEKKTVITFEMYDGKPLDRSTINAVLKHYRFVSFNGHDYDLPMICYALAGATNAQLKRASDKIIQSGLRRWQSQDWLGVRVPSWIDHIDLMEVAPGVQIGLKLYGGRMHSQRLQDLPIEPDELVADRREELKSYCVNDLDTTIDLWSNLRQQIELREQMSKEYDQDLRSKSDAQIAEAVLRTEVAKRMKVDKIRAPEVAPGTTFLYWTPDFISYQTPQFQEMLRVVQGAKFVIDHNGSPIMPDEIAGLKLKLGSSVYRMGIGGLHSSEQKQAVRADAEHILVDRDVASYYPAIILNCGLRPEHMGEHFTHVYRGIVNRRLAAKKAKDTVAANSLKIVINGSFGKLGSKWSSLYSPNLMIQTTITGQLSLLMLIEALEMGNISVVSANTDGIVIRCAKWREPRMLKVIKWWENVTGFETEETRYTAVYSRDVNNYIAIKETGFKTKGTYADPGLAKNPQNTIVTRAVTALLTKGTPIEETIIRCRDVREFLTVRRVTGGGMWGDRYLGKVVRWYRSTRGAEIGYAKQRNQDGTRKKVGGSDGAMPMMVLGDFPEDIDYRFYIDEAYDVLCDIGYMRPILPVGQWDSAAAADFIVDYLRRFGATSGEKLTDATKAAGIVPADDRSFGNVFGRLKKAERIRVVGTVPRTKGHNTTGGNIYEAVDG